jgi:hypothetical protein
MRKGTSRAACRTDRAGPVASFRVCTGVHGTLARGRRLLLGGDPDRNHADDTQRPPRFTVRSAVQNGTDQTHRVANAGLELEAKGGEDRVGTSLEQQRGPGQAGKKGSAGRRGWTGAARSRYPSTWPRARAAPPARVAELADAPDLGSGAERRGGSSPLSCTDWESLGNAEGRLPAANTP